MKRVQETALSSSSIATSAVNTPKLPNLPTPKRRCTRSATKINDLNGDVLSDTFDYLNIYELNEVAGVCRAFKKHADESFWKRYKEKEFEIKIGSRNWKPEPHEVDILLRSIQSILRNFGSLIHSLKVDCNRKNSLSLSLRVMKWINEYCGEMLKAITLSGVTLTASRITKLAPLLSQLEELNLYGCDLELAELAAVNMLESCQNIHTLQISRMPNFPICVKLPKLSSLLIQNCKGIDNVTLKNFLQVNRTLKEIEIFDYPEVADGIIAQIATYNPQLEKLHFAHSIKLNLEDVSVNIPRLTALTSLKIDFGGYSCSRLLGKIAAARVPIQNLDIGGYESDIVLANEIGKLSQLSKLRLVENIEASDVLKIVKNLSALSELSVNIRKLTSTELLQLIRFAPKLQTLNFENYGSSLCLDMKLYSEILIVVTSRQEKCRLEILYPQRKIDQSCLQLEHELLEIIGAGALCACSTPDAFISIG